MPTTQKTTITLEDYWRSVILQGANVASYKFALGKSLLELANEGKSNFTLEELAEPFSQHIVEHLGRSEKQITRKTPGKFLQACDAFRSGEMSKQRLVETTARLGFVNVIDAFHNVNRAEIATRFFIDKRDTPTGGIELTDGIFELVHNYQMVNLPHEIESRWRLVETAWLLQMPRNALTVEYDEVGRELFTVDRGMRRTSITGCRAALNGYQQGKCFYCYGDISVEAGAPDICHVDPFFPHSLKRHFSHVTHNINGVWNLVLACQDCNLEKWKRAPAWDYLEDLQTRNNCLISSHHPLRETIRQQTGMTTAERADFLRSAWNSAKKQLIHEWQTEAKGPKLFANWRPKI